MDDFVRFRKFMLKIKKIPQRIDSLKGILLIKTSVLSTMSKYVVTYLQDNLKDASDKIWLENVVIKEALPSPSSANARMTLEQKQKQWG